MIKKLLLVIPILMAMATTSSLAIPHFDINTTNITTSDTFTFAISAAGNFEIDCGTGGILNQNGAGVSGNIITRASATGTPDSYSCTYTSSGQKTVSIGGTATAYYNGQYVPAISFSGNTFVEAVTDHIIDVFPPVGNGTAYTNLPGFYETFKDCTNLSVLDRNIFLGYPGDRTSMFEGTFKNCVNLGSITGELFFYINTPGVNLFKETFAGCTRLGSIPVDLFGFNGTSVSGQSGMFEGTFSGCSSLTEIPEKLFFHVTTSAASMFANTFAGCTGLESIPDVLFDFGGNDVNGQHSLFKGTFAGCTNSKLTEIPNILFHHVTTSAPQMFMQTFEGCTGLASIPDVLFDFGGNSAVNGQHSLFKETFSGCSSLTEIPNILFHHVTTSAPQMFMQTFEGCTGVREVPSKLFSFGGNVVTGQSSLFRGTFQGCGGLVDLPDGLFAKVATSASQMFMETFKNCTHLEYITPYLFLFDDSDVTGQDSLFYETFSGCSSLTEIPNILFHHVTTSASQMFLSTFKDCTALTHIPADLFSFGGNPVAGQSSLFMGTFQGCTRLGYLPDLLFGTITSTASQMFTNTFNGCTGLTGYIPKSMFSSAIVPAPSTIPSGMMTSTFFNAGSLATTSTGCPNGTVYYQTGYETNYWDNHIVCEPGSTISYSCGTNGTGTAPADIDVPQNSSFTPAAGTPCTGNSGYGAFTGWLISGTNEVKPAGTAFTWTYTGNKTLTAQYTPNTLALNWYNTVTTMSVDSASQSCTYDGTLTVPSAPSARTGFTFAGWEVRPTYNFSTIPNTNGVEFWAKGYEGGTKCWYDTTTGNSTNVSCASDPNFADLANPTSSNSQRYQWKVRFPDGILYGFTRCSETQGTVGEAGTPSSTFGYNGWCMATGWKPNGATSPSSPTASLQWVMGYIPSDGTTDIMNGRCKRNVAAACANQIRSNSSFRTALFTPAQ